MILPMDRSICSIVVYGCAKNQVDAQEMAGRLRDAGFALTQDPSEADVIIIHTCGFIEAAKKESIEGILSAVGLSRERGKYGGKAPRIVVTGCLSQRYARELAEEIPEVDGFFGTRSPRDIVEIVRDALSDRKTVEEKSPGRGAPSPGRKRLVDTGTPWAYLKVSEGCRHRCTYCAIPSMRGPLASRTIEDILEEARYLVDLGIKELNLIAEDLSDYGLDIYGKRALPDLLVRLSQDAGVPWIRLLYVRPDGVTEDLASAMRDTAVVPYIDMPIEHGSDRILRLMGRPGKDQIRRAIDILTRRIPHISFRTTIIAGFPSETEEDIEDTLEFLQEIKPHRVAVFPYSREEGTPAFGFANQVPEDVKFSRAERLRSFGLDLAKSHSASLLGTSIETLLMKPSHRKGWWIGRGTHQAPEVDGIAYVKTQGRVGDIVKSKVTNAGILDVFCEGPLP